MIAHIIFIIKILKIPKAIIIDSIFQKYTYTDITNDTNIEYIIRSKDIGYFTVYFVEKGYYYIIWCDSTPTLYPISSCVYQYLDVLNYKFASESGIYFIVKYDLKTNDVLNLTKTLPELRDEFLKSVVIV